MLTETIMHSTMEKSVKEAKGQKGTLGNFPAIFLFCEEFKSRK